LFVSDARFTQVLPQSVVPAGQAQVPSVQIPFVGHAWPHPPQF
jgi:hypothetical protein